MATKLESFIYLVLSLQMMVIFDFVPMITKSSRSSFQRQTAFVEITVSGTKINTRLHYIQKHHQIFSRLLFIPVPFKSHCNLCYTLTKFVLTHKADTTWLCSPNILFPLGCVQHLKQLEIGSGSTKMQVLQNLTHIECNLKRPTTGSKR